jgi:hypothetical protein
MISANVNLTLAIVGFGKIYLPNTLFPHQWQDSASYVLMKGEW